MKKTLLRGSVVLLIAIGVVSAAGRALFVPDLMSIAEPGRVELLALVHDTPVPHSQEDLQAFDGRYAMYPRVTLLHVIPGGLFLALAPLQFWAALRRRYASVHRWSGRVLLIFATLAIASALHLAFVVPFSGVAETVTIAFFGGLFIFSLTRAYVAIRRRDVGAHREWMIRGFAIALAISTVRIAGAAIDLVLMPSGVDAQRMFVVSLWIGWVVTIAVAEAWIRHTRPSHELHTPTVEAARRYRFRQSLAGLRRGW